MKILVTGSAGFVGSHLTERFLQEGHQVVGVDR
ncbi:NAD-dependent epimerase/dehydratase family protein [Deinococcus malanensis]|nr:NAD(P)-dependent oxidoreductase [Deinococcus malanensis]